MLFNRRVLVIFSILALVSLARCTFNKKDTKAQKAPKIGFVLATMNEERYQRDKQVFIESVTELGGTVEFASSGNQVATQTSKVETLLSKGIDVLVIQPVNGDAAASVVSLAKKDGIPVVAYDRLIKNADIDLYVTQDSEKVGRLQAAAALKVMAGKGNIVILQGEAGHSVAEAITRGALEEIKKYPGAKVVLNQQHPGWSSSLALSTVENALTRQNNNIQAILANNDGMALGAIRALEEQKLAGKVFVAGADADLAAIKNIVAGKQSFTVLKGIKPLAQGAAVAAMKLARGEKVAVMEHADNGMKSVPMIPTPVFGVDAYNIESQIIEYGFHPRDAIYGAVGR